MMANEERIRNAIKEDSSKHLTIEQWDIRTIMDKHPLERAIEGARKEQQEKDIQRAVNAACDCCSNKMCYREIRQEKCQVILHIKQAMKGE